jgi:hypothetical protein
MGAANGSGYLAGDIGRAVLLGAAIRMLLWMAAAAAGLFGVAGFFSRCLEKIEPECRYVSCCCMMWMTPAGRSI